MRRLASSGTKMSMSWLKPMKSSSPEIATDGGHVVVSSWSTVAPALVVICEGRPTRQAAPCVAKLPTPRNVWVVFTHGEEMTVWFWPLPWAYAYVQVPATTSRPPVVRRVTAREGVGNVLPMRNCTSEYWYPTVAPCGGVNETSSFL